MVMEIIRVNHLEHKVRAVSFDSQTGVGFFEAQTWLGSNRSCILGHRYQFNA